MTRRLSPKSPRGVAAAAAIRRCWRAQRQQVRQRSREKQAHRCSCVIMPTADSTRVIMPTGRAAASGWLAETAQPKKQAVLPAEDRNRPAIFTRPSQLKIFRLVDHHTHLRGERTTTRFVLRDAVIPPPGLLLQATGHRLVRLVWCSMAAATTAHSSSIIVTDDVPSACDTLVLLVGCHTLLKSLIAASKVLRSGWKLAQSLS
jgi:hypothetical protein